MNYSTLSTERELEDLVTQVQNIQIEYEEKKGELIELIERLEVQTLTDDLKQEIIKQIEEL